MACTWLSQQIIGAAHRLIQEIRSHSAEGGRQEQRLSYNVVSSLAATLQELSTDFRRSQNSYLRSKCFNPHVLYILKSEQFA
jgi:hypothetical protein